MRWIIPIAIVLFYLTAAISQSIAQNKMVNGVPVPMTAQDIATRDAVDAAKAARDAAAVPSFITRYQLLAALRQMNRAAAFASYVSGLSATDQEWWQNKGRFRRDAAQVVALKLAAPAGMGLTDAQIDGVWRLALTFDD